MQKNNLMKRIVLGIEYDGYLWYGWQKQNHKLTIQNVLENAIKKFTLININVICSSRTDTGVHALEQIIHFDINLKRKNFSWVEGINHFLPPSIIVIWAFEFILKNFKKNIFHARYSAISRTYQYILYNNIVKSPLLHGKVGWVYKKININLIKTAAKYLIGTHDFLNFKSSKCQSKNSIRTINFFKIYKYKKFIIFIIKANSFLYHMVRNIIGILIMIGNGNKHPMTIYKLLNIKNKYNNIYTFMPNGLYLTKIKYSKKWNLPQTKNINFPLNIYKYLIN